MTPGKKQGIAMENPVPDEIDVFQVKDLLDSGSEFVFLDCREPDEFQRCRIETARLMPLGQIPQRVGSLEEHRDQRIVIYCHHGRRSLYAAAWLREQGFDRAQSMAGGIDEWSQTIDSSIPRY